MTLDPRARTLTLSAADLPSLAGADGLAATFVKLDAGSSGEAASSVRTIALPPTPKLTELQLWRFPELRELSLDAPRLTIFQAYGVPLLERVSPLPRLRSLQASCSLAVFAGSLAAVREIHQIHVDEAARPALGELEAVTHFVCVTPLERLDFFPVARGRSAVAWVTVTTSAEWTWFNDRSALDGRPSASAPHAPGSHGLPPPPGRHNASRWAGSGTECQDTRHPRRSG